MHSKKSMFIENGNSVLGLLQDIYKFEIKNVGHSLSRKVVFLLRKSVEGSTPSLLRKSVEGSTPSHSFQFLECGLLYNLAEV